MSDLVFVILTVAFFALASLILKGGGAAVSIENAAGLWRRAKVRMFGGRLDQDLARGFSPDATVEHSLRAAYLARTDQRQLTARALELVLGEATSPARPAAGAARRISGVTRSVVLANAYNVSRLATRLASSEPVSPRGLAMARSLVTNGAGPLHYGGSVEKLRCACERIQDALDPEIPQR